MLVGPLPHIATVWDGREKDFQRGEGRLTSICLSGRMSQIYNKSENNCFTGQLISLRSRESIHAISRLRESVLSESIHVTGAKTSQNMPIHDEIGLIAL